MNEENNIPQNPDTPPPPPPNNDLGSLPKFSQVSEEEATQNNYQQVPPPPPSGSGNFLDNERTYVMIMYFSQFLSPLTGGLAFLIPIIMWAIKKDQSEFIDDQGKEIINFIITTAILAIFFIFLSFLLIGIPLLIALGIYGVITTIIGGIKANEGVRYRYPFILRLV